jgi:hypothetical protein
MSQALGALATWKTGIRKITIQDQPEQTVCKIPPISKITSAKWTEGVAQAVEHLLCKHKALGSNSRFPQKKKRHQLISSGTISNYLIHVYVKRKRDKNFLKTKYKTFPNFI